MVVPSSHAWQSGQTLKDRYLPHMISNHFHVWGLDQIHNIHLMEVIGVVMMLLLIENR